MRRYALTVDGAPLPGGEYRPVELRCKGSMPNVILHTDEVVNAIGRPLRPVEEDWFDLLRAIHAADLVCARGRNADWNREIAISLPLRDPSPFEPLLPTMCELFGLLTHDLLTISLYPDPEPIPARFPTRKLAGTGEAVALLSGGLDSACAAARLYESGTRTYFVSSRSSPHIGRAQDAVLETLSAQAGAFGQPVHFRPEIKHRHPEAPLPESDLSQRSRTLLYTGVAATIAVAHGIAEVQLGENGIMAINCPLTEGRGGGFSTHTAHPDILRLMGRLYTQVLSQPVQVVNPLLPQTKTEVVAELAAGRPGAMIPRTHSCWIARQATHCGTCIPCIVRRFATEAAGVDDVRYQHDVFDAPAPPADEPFAGIGDYLLFVRDLSAKSDDDLLFDYAELNLAGGSALRAQAIATYRRWAADVLGVIGHHPALGALL